MSALYELVKQSKDNGEKLQTVVNLFEPKIKKSLQLTNAKEKEDLSQELKCKLISCIQNYDIDSTPGFWDFKEKMRKR